MPTTKNKSKEKYQKSEIVQESREKSKCGKIQVKINKIKMKIKHEMHFWELWEGNEKKKIESKLIFYKVYEKIKD